MPLPEPGAKRQRIILSGDVPSPINPPTGCRFHTRCPYAFDRCRVEEPEMREILPGHMAACHLREPQTAAAPSPAGEGKRRALPLRRKPAEQRRLGGARRR